MFQWLFLNPVVNAPTSSNKIIDFAPVTELSRVEYLEIGDDIGNI